MLSSIVNNLISDLKPRQQGILIGRFGLDKGEKKTLASLGEKYDVTRERVRQIEEDAIRTIQDRLGARKKTMEEISRTIAGHLDNLGGLRKDDLFVQELKTLLNDKILNHWHLKFFSEIYKTPFYYPADSDFHHFWYLDPKNLKIANRFIAGLEKLIAAKKEDLTVNKKFDVYLIKAAKSYDLPDLIGINYLSVSRRFSTNPFGDFGLSHWEEITPKTIKSKIYLILKKSSQPMHFRSIAETIDKTGFDQRRTHPQTVHNELIKDPRFILIGRGIYGLAERGFKPGFTRQIITDILKEKGPLKMNQIIDLVLKQRVLKENTIILNLQNRKYFKKLADGRYSIR